jgi:hypothetical protein
MTKAIHIDQLRLRLPASALGADPRAAETLARSVAAGLAQSLRTGEFAPSPGRRDTVRVRLPSGPASTAGLTRAIQASVGQALAARRKGT